MTGGTQGARTDARPTVVLGHGASADASSCPGRDRRAE